MTVAEQPDKVITEEGLTMKGVRKIERINCDYSLMSARPLTWQCSRVIRRDFYLVTYKMFFSLRNKAGRIAVRHLLAAVQEEAERLRDMTRRYELPAIPSSTDLNLRLVNEEARTLLECLLTADKALSKMKKGEMHEVADENCIPFFAAYARLKKFVLEFNRSDRQDTEAVNV